MIVSKPEQKYERPRKKSFFILPSKHSFPVDGQLLLKKGEVNVTVEVMIQIGPEQTSQLLLSGKLHCWKLYCT